MLMRKNILFIVALLLVFATWSQDKKPIRKGEETIIDRGEPKDSEGGYQSLRDRGKDKKEKPPIEEYRIVSIENDTTYVDTSLTIQKDYRFNYLRRDDFGLLPIHNVGQTYTSLEKQETSKHLLPLFGARARHFNFIEARDMLYYYVPTPLTELYFKTTFEQGQQLDAFFTVNTSPQLNLSIAYKGVRSLGKYQQALTSTGNFRATASYITKNKRYSVKTHFVSQDLNNEENGGLSDEGIDQYLARAEFVGEESEFTDRGAISVNFTDAESILLGKRFYLNHKYDVVKNTDSTALGVSVGHVLDLTDKRFRFSQAAIAPSNLLGEAYVSTDLSDNVALEDFSNRLFVEVQNKWLGNLRISGGNSNYNYGYNSLLSQVDGSGNQTSITNRLKGDVYSIGGKYTNEYKGFQLFADGQTIISGDLTGNYIHAGTGYELNEKYALQAELSANSVAPNYNFLLYQSDYVNYNWQNDFDNVNTKKAKVILKAKNIANLEASYTTISNHTYFTKNANSAIVPMQANNDIEVLKAKLSQEVKYWKLGLDNTVLYQNTSGGNQIYNVPRVTTRNTLYYHDHWFKKALYMQAGVTLKYFTSYTADGYDPVLSEFYTQNTEEIGGFPQFDIFFNAKVRQTRIYFKFENIGEAFRQNQEFSAPGYATRDAVLRFGLVWNFFM